MPLPTLKTGDSIYYYPSGYDELLGKGYSLPGLVLQVNADTVDLLIFFPSTAPPHTAYRPNVKHYSDAGENENYFTLPNESTNINNT